MVTLTRLSIHPVKLVHDTGLTHTLTDASDLAFNRIFMATEPDGTFVTAHQFPLTIRFTPSPVYDGLHLTVPDGSSVYIHLVDFTTQDISTEVWGTHFTARIVPNAINKWLSGFFSHEVQLRWVGPQVARCVKRHNTVSLLFADDYPYLLANEASLRDFQQRYPVSIRMGQFCPNLVASGISTWKGDSRKVICIGDVASDMVKPCSRCIFTIVSPGKGQKHPTGEPLKTLQSFRIAQDNDDVDLGQDLIARNDSVIRVGDEVEILAATPAKIYGAGAADNTTNIAQQLDVNADIDWQGQASRGNNQQVLLE